MKKIIYTSIIITFILLTNSYTKEFYTIQLGAFKNVKNALNLQKKLLKSNFPVYSKKDKGFCIVYSGLYTSKDIAEFNKEFLEKKVLHTKTIIRKKVFNSVRKQEFIPLKKFFNEVKGGRKNVNSILIVKDKKISKNEIQIKKKKVNKRRNIRKSKKQKKLLISKIINESKKFLNVRYKWGGVSKKGVDCSGLIYLVFRKFGIYLPRTAREQSRIGKRVRLKKIKKGDIIFFYKKNRRIPSHLGIYLGNKKFIHASNHTKKVIISSLESKYFRKHIYSIKRII